MDLGTELQIKSCWISQDQVIRCSVGPVLWRGELRSKVSGKKSIHFNGGTKNIELLLQIVFSVNQLSIHGAVADMIEELPVGQGAPVKPIAPGQLDKVEILTQLLLAKTQAKEERQGNLNTSNDLNNCEKTRSYPNYAPKQVWDQSKLDNSSMLFRHREVKKMNLHAENIQCLEIKKELTKQCTVWPCLGHE